MLRRAAELAAGGLDKHLAELSDLAFTQIEGHMHRDASQEDRSIVLQDFEYAKAYANFALVAKLSFWKTLPWKIAGLAHHRPSVRQLVAKQLLDDFQASVATGAEAKDHHALTLQFLGEEGTLRQHVQARRLRRGNGHCHSLYQGQGCLGGATSRFAMQTGSRGKEHWRCLHAKLAVWPSELMIVLHGLSRLRL